jgi:uncharacterized protein (TIGR03067 family)
MNQETGDRRQETGQTAGPDFLTPVPCPLSPTDASRSPKQASRSRLVWLAALVAVVVALGGFAVWYFLIRQPEPRNDLERFEGDWAMTVAGVEKPTVIRVKGDRWEWTANAVEGKAYRVTLNETANPKEIDLDPIDPPRMIGPVPRLYGVYAFDGNTVRVRLSDATQPRPKTLDDPDAIVWVLTKVKLEPTP